MKTHLKPLLIVSAALTILSLFALIWAVQLPDATEVTTTALSYEHTGTFDYSAYLEPSYLFGPDPVETPAPLPSAVPLSKPKYPVDSIDNIRFDFEYNFETEDPVGEITGTVRASAAARDANNKSVTLDLAGSAFSGSTAITSFALPFSENLSGNIYLTISVYTTVETAKGPFFESFEQELTLERNGPDIVIDRQLSQVQDGNTGFTVYRQSGSIDYTVVTRLDSPLHGLEIAAPEITPEEQEPDPDSVDAPPVGRVLKPGEGTIFLSLLEKIDAGFEYRFKSSRPVENLSEDVEIVAILEGAGQWSKTFTLVPETTKTGDFSIEYPLDITALQQTIGKIQSEIGVTTRSYTLSVQADIHMTGDTPYGQIDETFAPVISYSLDNATLTWTGDPVQKQTGTIDVAETIPNTNRYLGMTPRGMKTTTEIITPVLFVTSLVLASFYIVDRRKRQVSPIEKEITHIQRKYADRIVEVAGNNSHIAENILNVGSFEDLIIVADELGKPVIYRSSGNPMDSRTYHVYDDNIVYEYTFPAPASKQTD